MIAHFSIGTRISLGSGMTGFDTTWYHGPFAAGFAAEGSTLDLQLIAPQYLAWFYPQNSELLHAAGILAFGRDILSPLFSLGWLAGCLAAAWCIGRPFGAGPASMAGAALVLGSGVLADQSGEARNDIPAIFFLLAAAAIAVNAWAARPRGEGLPPGALAAVGIAAGLAAGTKVNYLAPAAAFAIGLAVLAPPGRRARSFAVAAGAAFAAGGYWYLRNLVHSGNPLPWLKGIVLPGARPAARRPRGARDHRLPARLRRLGGLVRAGAARRPRTALAAARARRRCRGRSLPRPPRRAGAAPARGSGPGDGGGVARRSRLRRGPGGVARSASSRDFATWPRRWPSHWRCCPWRPACAASVHAGSSSEGSSWPCRSSTPRASPGRRSTSPPRSSPASPRLRWGPCSPSRGCARHRGRSHMPAPPCSSVAAVAAGYRVQRSYLENRYAEPTFTTPGLDAAFAWARDLEDTAIATTTTRQYPFWGTDLSNRVRFVGVERPHGGFVRPPGCAAFRRAVNEIATAVSRRIPRPRRARPRLRRRGRLGEGDPAARVVLRRSPTVVFELSGPLDPASCPSP